jgi:hypothetical protein
VTATTGKKRSTRTRPPSKAELRRRALKGAETKRLKAAAEEKARRAAARRRAQRKQAKEETHRRHVEAGKKGARTRLAKERARATLETFVRAVDHKTREHELLRVKESWHKAKRELGRALDGDYDRYLAILDELADDEGTDWDIAYGSTESAA